MITAIMARKNTEETKKNLARQTKERAYFFCEEKISSIIANESKKGKNQVFVDIDEDIVNEVKIKLLANSFKIGPGTNARSVSIMW